MMRFDTLVDNETLYHRPQGNSSGQRPPAQAENASRGAVEAVAEGASRQAR